MSTSSGSSPIGPANDDEIDCLSHMARRWTPDADADPRAPARWSRLLDERARRARRARRRAVVLTSVVLVLAGLAGGGVWRGRKTDVTYFVAGAASVVEGGYVHDVGAAGARLQFSDGTAIDLAAGARAWLVSRDARGARLRIEEGRAHFEVVHRAQARWSVDAGPFAIEVTGTSFDVRWAGAAEELDVALARGSVIVRGPLAGAGIVLRPGQRLVALLRQQTVRVEDPEAPPGRIAPDAPAARATPVAPPPPSPSSEPRAASVAPPRPRVSRDKPQAPPVAAPTIDPASWSRRVAAGEFLDVLAEAERGGIDGCLASCPVEALAALADAARYGGRPALARRVLLATRDRFPGSVPARAAAFLLGRMADGAAAVEWYDRYLAESPEGVYAAEALGRKMMAIERLGDRSSARRIAAEYRSRFPAGAYLPQATALLQHP